jgi:hypothetical protein
MGFIDAEPGSCSETCVECDVDGTEEVSIKVEDTIDVKEEVSIKIEEAIDIKDEFPEVRLWGVCEVMAAHAFRPFIAHQKREILKLHFTISCFVLYCGCCINFEIWITIMMRRDILEVIAINGRIIVVLEYVDCNSLALNGGQ